MLTTTDRLSFALAYQRNAIAADLAGNSAHGDALRAKAAFHFAKAGC